MILGYGLTLMVDGNVDEKHRRIYRREGNGYPSDLRDAKWRDWHR